MAKKPTSRKRAGTTVTVVRTRPKAVQVNDVVRQAVLGKAIGTRGGSAAVHAFDSPQGPSRVAKIYKDEFRADRSHNPFEKLVAFVHRYEELAARLPFVLWPDEPIFDRADLTPDNVRQALLGFTMLPLPAGTIPLFSVLKEKMHRATLSADAAVRLAARLADHMAQLHQCVVRKAVGLDVKSAMAAGLA